MRLVHGLITLGLDCCSSLLILATLVPPNFSLVLKPPSELSLEGSLLNVKVSNRFQFKKNFILFRHPQPALTLPLASILESRSSQICLLRSSHADYFPKNCVPSPSVYLLMVFARFRIPVSLLHGKTQSHPSRSTNVSSTICSDVPITRRHSIFNILALKAV